jgi:P-type Cu2+ transporter
MVISERPSPLDVLGAIALSHETVHKMRQNPVWAVGYNNIAVPTAALARSTFPVTLNALLLERTKREGIRRYGAE